jgi:hypothetical protein
MMDVFAIIGLISLFIFFVLHIQYKIQEEISLIREKEKFRLQKMQNDADRVYLIKEKLRYVNQVKELRKQIKELKKSKGLK